MRQPYQIITAREFDLDLLPEIERASAAIFPEGRLPDPDDVMPRSDLEKAAREGLLFAAVYEEQVVGFAMASQDADELYFAVMAVHPMYGRRGIGTSLVIAVIDASRSRCFRGVTLTTFQDVPWNAPFYANLGFEVLTEAELSPLLHEELAKQEKAGLTNRIAMRYRNAA